MYALASNFFDVLAYDIYRMVLPGKEQSTIAKGEFPKPPDLFKGKGVTDDEPGESYWKVANGIRLTGMPGFDQQLSTTEMWQVSLLVANADKLPESAKAVLAGPNAAVTPETTASDTQSAPKP